MLKKKSNLYAINNNIPAKPMADNQFKGDAQFVNAPKPSAATVRKSDAAGEQNTSYFDYISRHKRLSKEISERQKRINN